MHSLVFRFISILCLLCGFALALSAAPDAANAVRSPTINEARSADTCADPSLAKTVYQGFGAGGTVHVLNYRHVFENANTVNQANIWTDLHPAFLAWPTQQNFTLPLFQLGTADGTQYIYRIGTDANTPPVVSGFVTDNVSIGWVYNTQVCGSVPLMSAALAQFTDHYFTIDSFEHESLISAPFGWTDSGVVAYVLPLYNS